MKKLIFITSIILSILFSSCAMLNTEPHYYDERTESLLTSYFTSNELNYVRSHVVSVTFHEERDPSCYGFATCDTFGVTGCEIHIFLGTYNQSASDLQHQINKTIIHEFCHALNEVHTSYSANNAIGHSQEWLNSFMTKLRAYCHDNNLDWNEYYNCYVRSYELGIY